MPEDTKDKAKFLGLPVELFEAGVDALVKLRDSGKFLLFLPRRNWVRFVGEFDDFKAAFAQESEDEESADADAKSVLREIRILLGQRLKSADADLDSVSSRVIQTVTHLIETGKDEGEQAKFGELLKAKLSIIEEKVMTNALRRRAIRMETAGSGCLEELDAEIVRERRDELSELVTDVPFLRLRFRYSETPLQDVLPFFFGLISPDKVEPTDSFELECDESDIDLMIRRLVAAKQRLIDASNVTAESEDE